MGAAFGSPQDLRLVGSSETEEGASAGGVPGDGNATSSWTGKTEPTHGQDGSGAGQEEEAGGVSGGVVPDVDDVAARCRKQSEQGGAAVVGSSAPAVDIKTKGDVSRASLFHHEASIRVQRPAGTRAAWRDTGGQSHLAEEVMDDIIKDLVEEVNTNSSLTCVLMTLAFHFKRTALALFLFLQLYVCASRRGAPVTFSIPVPVSGKIQDSWKAMHVFTVEQCCRR